MIQYGYIYFAISLVLILVLRRFIIQTIESGSVREKIPADVVNGLVLIIKFTAAIAIIYAATVFLDIGTGTTIILSVFLGSIISFASINTIQNLISGVYILLTEPFSVNDLVKISSSEGVVTEISLNYTSLLNFDGVIERIPNKKIINSLIINYDEKVKPKPLPAYEEMDWMRRISRSLEDREITRYVFVWGAPLIDLKQIKKKLDNVCDEFIEVFGYRPSYTPFTINHRFEFSFILKADSPITILKHKPRFLNAISLQFH